MRRFIAFAVVLLFAQSSQAVTLYTKLQDIGSGGLGVHTIGIYIQTDPNSTADDLGFSGAQFDVIAQDTNTNYTGTSFSVPTTTVLNYGYSKINPIKVDATTSNESVSAMMPQPVTGLNNGNLDAVGFSLSVTPGNVDPVGLGAVGQTGGFELVGKEVWNSTDFDILSALKLYLTGAQYFDPSDQQGTTFKNYDAVVFVPEPSSIALALFGGLSLFGVYITRHRARLAALSAKLALVMAVCLVANAASAVTISVMLQDLTGGNAPGIHTIGIYLKSDQTTSVDDLGISGTQIDVIAQDTNSNYTGTVSFSVSNVLGPGYSRINPFKIDGTTANASPEAMPGPETVLNNGNLDAMGLSIYTIPGNVDPPTNGAIGQSSGFEFIAQEAWDFTGVSTLKAFLVGAQYFDSADNGNLTDKFHDYDAGVSIPLTVVPEPASVILMTLGALGTICFDRRKVVC